MSNIKNESPKSSSSPSVPQASKKYPYYPRPSGAKKDSVVLGAEHTGVCPVCGSPLRAPKDHVAFSSETSTVRVGTQTVRLGYVRFKILHELWTHRGQFLSHEHCLYVIENAPNARGALRDAPNLLQVHVSHLRNFLRAHKLPFRIVTYHKYGYGLFTEEKP